MAVSTERIPVFIHNPKAASTSIREAIPGVKTASVKKYRHVHQPLSSRHVQEQLSAAGEKAWLFGVVRNPFGRFMSAWAYFKKPRGRTVPENYVLEACLQGGDVNAFVAMVDLEKISKVIPHFQRQTWFFSGNRKPDQLIRFEQLQEGIAALCANLGIESVVLPKSRASKHPGWRAALSPESKKKLRAFYRTDLEAFGYADL